MGVLTNALSRRTTREWTGASSAGPYPSALTAFMPPPSHRLQSIIRSPLYYPFHCLERTIPFDLDSPAFVLPRVAEANPCPLFVFIVQDITPTSVQSILPPFIQAFIPHAACLQSIPFSS